MKYQGSSHLFNLVSQSVWFVVGVLKSSAQKTCSNTCF